MWKSSEKFYRFWEKKNKDLENFPEKMAILQFLENSYFLPELLSRLQPELSAASLIQPPGKHSTLGRQRRLDLAEQRQNAELLRNGRLHNILPKRF